MKKFFRQLSRHSAMTFYHVFKKELIRLPEMEESNCPEVKDRESHWPEQS